MQLSVLLALVVAATTAIVLPRDVSTFTRYTCGGESCATRDVATNSIYLTCYHAGEVYRVLADGTVTKFASGLSYPWGLVLQDAQGLHLLVAEEDGNRIINVSTSTGQKHVMCGSGARSNIDATCAKATFYGPRGVAVTTKGKMWVAQYDGNVRKITLQLTPMEVTTVAGGLGRNYGIAVDAVGNLFVTDYDAHCVRRVDYESVGTSVFAGQCGTYGGDNGLGTNAQFFNPSGIVYHSAADCLIVTESRGCRVLVVTSSGNVTTLAGSYANCGAPIEGYGTEARFNDLYGTVAIDEATNVIYIPDAFNGLLRRLGGAALHRLEDATLSLTWSRSVTLTTTTSSSYSSKSLSMSSVTPSCTVTRTVASQTRSLAAGSLTASLSLLRSVSLSGVTASGKHSLSPTRTSSFASTVLLSLTLSQRSLTVSTLASPTAAKHSSRSATLASHHATRTFTPLTLSGSKSTAVRPDEFPIPLVPPTPAVIAATYAAAGAQWSSLIAPPISAVSLGRLVASRALFACGSHSKDEGVVGLLLVAVGNVDNHAAAQSLGTIGGNAVILCSAGALLLCVAVVCSTRCRLSFPEGLNRVALPSSLLLPWLMTLPTSGMALVHVVAASSSSPAVAALVAVGVAHCVSMFLLLLYVWLVLGTNLEIVCASSATQQASTLSRLPRSWLQASLRRLCAWGIRGSPLCDPAKPQQDVSCRDPLRWASVVLDDHCVLWYPVFDSAALLAASVVVGTATYARSADACRGAAVALMSFYTSRSCLCVCSSDHSPVDLDMLSHSLGLCWLF